MSLQLEAVYRKNVEKIASEMKRRIDYLQETEAIRRAFAREYMLKWIIDGVRGSVLPLNVGSEIYCESRLAEMCLFTCLFICGVKNCLLV